jgi:predicted pyridoxine 5'-phosphate oxidase superfamily flavin-nucleotide-binding protein
MSEFFDHIIPEHADFIARQPVFFVATAAPDARINLSPKGMDTFRVLEGGKACAYLDFGGSGNETHAHLGADGRITIMFCAFDQPARKIIRQRQLGQWNRHGRWIQVSARRARQVFQ